MKAKRQSMVEPVFSTLTQFMRLRKINTIGIKQANKLMHLSAMAYNLKKYLKFTHKKVKSGVESVFLSGFYKNPFYKGFFFDITVFKIGFHYEMI